MAQLIVFATTAFAPQQRPPLRPAAARTPSLRLAASDGELIQLSEVEEVAARLGCRLAVSSIGPAYKVELLWASDVAQQMIGGDASRPDLLGSSEGFTQPTGVVHLENIQLRRFTGYWRRSWSRRYEATPKLKRRHLGLLVSVGVAAWIKEQDPFQCQRMQLLAIFDEEKQHATLVRYYRRLGFKEMRDVGDDFRGVADRMVWGGVGTLMEGSVDDFLRKWGDAVRSMEPATVREDDDDDE